jgi:hypothetical protein
VGTNAEIVVLNSSGKLVMESIIETKANTILDSCMGCVVVTFAFVVRGTVSRGT